MARFAEADISGVNLGSKTIQIKLYEEEEVLGTLTIGKASILWKPKHKKKGYRIDLETFEELAERFGESELD